MRAQASTTQRDECRVVKLPTPSVQHSAAVHCREQWELQQQCNAPAVVGRARASHTLSTSQPHPENLFRTSSGSSLPSSSVRLPFTAVMMRSAICARWAQPVHSASCNAASASREHHQPGTDARLHSSCKSQVQACWWTYHKQSMMSQGRLAASISRYMNGDQCRLRSEGRLPARQQSRRQG